MNLNATYLSFFLTQLASAHCAPKWQESLYIFSTTFYGFLRAKDLLLRNVTQFTQGTLIKLQKTQIKVSVYNLSGLF